jgi:WD40 repeat protein
MTVLLSSSCITLTTVLAYTCQAILTYRKHSGNIYSVRWSPNGKFIASCAEDTTVQVWKATD